MHGGGVDEGLYYPWDLDNNIPDKICELDDIPIYKSSMVLEGGAITLDGEGTLITTEECLLNINRNPNIDKVSTELYLKKYFNVKKVIWLPKGMYLDETGGHVDNICSFIKPSEVIIPWTDDIDDPQAQISMNIHNLLSNETDAKNRTFKIHKINQPKIQRITHAECQQYSYGHKTIKREPNNRLPASYINLYQNERAIFLPVFGDENDESAIALINNIVPDKEIIPFHSRDLLLGGGNIHCITQQIPEIY